MLERIKNWVVCRLVSHDWADNGWNRRWCRRCGLALRPCPTCKTKGWTGKTFVTCETCKGTGAEKSTGSVHDPCHVCRGVGCWEKQIACTVCNGNGWVRRPRADAAAGDA